MLRTLTTSLASVGATLALLLGAVAVSSGLGTFSIPLVKEAVVSAPLQPLHKDATATGIDGLALSTLRWTDSIDLWTVVPNHFYNEVTYHLDVTTTTSLAITVECQESDDDSTWFYIPYCSDSDAATCGPATLTYGVDDISVTAKPRAQFVRCGFEDLADGDATLVVTATVTAQ